MKTVLQGFQRTKEWADLIQNLSRLQKVLIKYKFVHEICNKSETSPTSAGARVLPHTVECGKILAMCLTPGHPAGVHLKALEIYQTLFDNLSRTELIKDMGLWLCGLLPLSSFASSRVRPCLLTLLSKYIVTLGVSCRLALDGLIAALLPCIVEVSSDSYFDALELLNKLKDTTGPKFFFNALMKTIINVSSVRVPATHYLGLTLKENLSEFINLLKNEHGFRSLFVECIHATICDDQQLLAQRNILDVLTNFFPLHQSILDNSQLIVLIHRLLPAMLKRNESVNRRIFQWLLNADADGKTTM